MPVLKLRISSIITFTLFLLLTSSLSTAGENCSMMGGKCRDACGPSEKAEVGDFLDCGEKQECCVAHDPGGNRINCCVYSFDTRHYGSANCGLPINNTCPKGSGSPLACEKLKMCKE